MNASSRVNPVLLVVLLGGMPIVSCGGSEDRQFGNPLGGQGGSAGSGATGGGSAATGGSGATDGTGGTDGSSGTGGGPSTCQSVANCDDGNTCNGAETCSSTGSCEPGTNAADQTPCTLAGATGNHYCNSGNCEPSRCGDEVVDAAADPAEQCDDGNQINGDGCEEDCTFSCSANAECDNGNPCDGVETCDPAQHKCAAGQNAADGTSCGANPDRVCRQGGCVPRGCGNSVREGAEECDDGNTVEADGCDNDCTFSCKADADCDNANRCDGVEKCNVATHVCTPGTPLTCDDANPCTRNECDASTGCVNPLIDADLDGHAPESLGSCGDDCDDADKTVYAGAPELCDNKDNNCNGVRDDSAPNWYVDCDGDGYAPAGAPAVKQCAKPAPPTGCEAGAVRDWTSRVPADLGTIDCWDQSAGVNPSITTYSTRAITGRNSGVDFDYNCDGEETPFWTATRLLSTSACGRFGTIGAGGISGVTSAEETDTAAAGVGGTVGIGGSGAICYGTDGWVGTAVPACGTFASFSECTSTASGCFRDHGPSEQQKCR